jgi:DNA-binding transcriptional MerR regulator
MRLTIGELAGETGCKAETIRYYERIGLLACAHRTQSGCRTYGRQDVRRLRFFRRSRDLGFSLDAIRGLLDLARPNRDCAAADRLSSAHLEEVRDKASMLRRLQRELIRMVAQCRGGRVAECRVIEALSD